MLKCFTSFLDKKPKKLTFPIDSPSNFTYMKMEFHRFQLFFTDFSSKNIFFFFCARFRNRYSNLNFAPTFRFNTFNEFSFRSVFWRKNGEKQLETMKFHFHIQGVPKVFTLPYFFYRNEPRAKPTTVSNAKFCVEHFELWCIRWLGLTCSSCETKHDMVSKKIQIFVSAPSPLEIYISLMFLKLPSRLTTLRIADDLC